MRPAVPLWIGAMLFAGLADARAQAPSPEAQAEEGARLFAAHCTVCHGDAMTGGDHGPSLKGAAFWSEWQGQPARTLYSRIISTMPASEPGSLSPDETMALVAQIARANGHPLARPVQSPDQLDAITLAAGQ